MASKILLRLEAYRALMSARRDAYRLRRTKVRNVLIVCYGNIHRSAFLSAFLLAHGGGRWEVRSAGFHPVAGRGCSEQQIAAAAERGIDLSRHRSRTVSASDFDWADLIVVMDRHNWHALRQLGVGRTKVIWAGALTSGAVEIDDPYGRSEAALARTIDRLVESGERLIELLASQDCMAR